TFEPNAEECIVDGRCKHRSDWPCEMSSGTTGRCDVSLGACGCSN
uniref:Conotoxin Cl9a n=1 Tax=Californiconus californicus TaxID=1736779 RepID=CU9A_CONCL|nr:RecName: Full=Conotoxin Cl9a; AltName: Full=Cal9.7 [Californiconus californicus]